MMSKKILLILVGGTICTSVNEHGTRYISERASARLRENYMQSDSPYAKNVQIDTTENFYILSENMTVDKWNSLVNCFREHSKDSQYDGVIVAHGTDTLAYSAALFSLILSGTDVPVFFVSSNEPLSSERANGDANFRYAVECICRGIAPNVYVTYKNISDGRMFLHLASRLQQCSNYSDDFYSAGAIDITDISDGNYEACFDLINERYPQSKVTPLIDLNGEWELSNCVLKIDPYVGLDYEAFNYRKFKAVIHGTYHSGTACAEKTKDFSDYGKNSILAMLDMCASAGAEVYISPSKITGEVYETVPIIANHKANGKYAHFLYGYTNEMAYVKVLLAYSIYSHKDEIDKFISTDCNFETAYK